MTLSNCLHTLVCKHSWRSWKKRIGKGWWDECTFETISKSWWVYLSDILMMCMIFDERFTSWETVSAGSLWCYFYEIISMSRQKFSKRCNNGKMSLIVTITWRYDSFVEWLQKIHENFFLSNRKNIFDGMFKIRF